MPHKSFEVYVEPKILVWARECAEEKRNTFLYINAEAPYLLTWNKEKVAKGEIMCLEDFREILG